jgi:FdhE protein
VIGTLPLFSSDVAERLKVAAIYASTRAETHPVAQNYMLGSMWSQMNVVLQRCAIAVPAMRPDNDAVTNRQRRIRRAEDLADKFSFAKEMLSFYGHVVRFQDDLEQKLVRMAGQQPAIGTELGADHLQVLLGGFSAFLRLCREQGPAGMADVVTSIHERGTDFEAALLQAVWVGSDADRAQGTLAKAFLQPCAELLRSRASLSFQNYVSAVCPFCQRKPVAGVLRSVGEGAARSLFCSFCSQEWNFRRIVCAGCGEENPQKLPVYEATEFTQVRVECCDTCKTYLKTIDLSKDGHADVIVDEIASMPLDLWARQRGYAKLQNNLLGM